MAHRLHWCPLQRCYTTVTDRFDIFSGVIIGKALYFERARAMCQTTKEPALLQCADKPMNPRFTFQSQGVFHLIKGRRDAVVFKSFMDENQ